jgi:hypothetical protein
MTMLKRLIIVFALLLPVPVAAQVLNGTAVNFTNNPTRMTAGAGSPEATVTGAPGDVYISTNGSVYSKAAGSGTDTTGWVALGGGGSGTVTSVGLTMPSIFSVSGTPVTTSGTIAASLATQSAKTFFSGPTSGAAATPTFRTMGTADLPVCASTKIYKSDGSAMVCDDDAGASSGAPTAAQYVTLATDATLTNERVLTAGTGVTFVDAGAGSTLTISSPGAGALVLLEQYTASTSATLDFTTFLSATYDTYQFELIDVLPATSTADLWIRMGTGAGPTWDSGANYTWAYSQDSQIPNTANLGAAGASAIKIGHSLGNGATNGVSGEVMLYNPQSAVVHKRLTVRLADVDSSGNFVSASAAGQYVSATALTGIRFLMSSGNITSGTIRVYGLAK